MRTQSVTRQWADVLNSAPELRQLPIRLLSHELTLRWGVPISASKAFRLVKFGRVTYHKVVKEREAHLSRERLSLLERFNVIWSFCFERTAPDTRWDRNHAPEFLTDSEGKPVEERNAGFIRAKVRYRTKQGAVLESWASVTEHLDTTVTRYARDKEGRKVKLDSWQSEKPKRIQVVKTQKVNRKIEYIESSEGHKVDGIVRRYIRKLFNGLAHSQRDPQTYADNIGYAVTFDHQTGRSHVRSHVLVFNWYDVEQDVARILWECVCGSFDNELTKLCQAELSEANLERIRKTLCVVAKRRFLDLLHKAEATPLSRIDSTDTLIDSVTANDLLPEGSDEDMLAIN